MLVDHFKRGLTINQSAEALTEHFGMRFTRSMVIGRCWRLKLGRGKQWPERAIIKAKNDEARRQAQEELRLKREALNAHRLQVQERAAAAKAEKAEKARQRAEERAKSRVWTRSPTALSVVTKDAVMGLQAQSCRYPIGHVGDATFRFCSKPREDGSSYCAEHRSICTVKMEPRSQMLAARV